MKNQSTLKEIPSKFSVHGELTALEKTKLRNKIVHLESKEVRRCRIRFHEALLIELKEAHVDSAFEFFEELIQHDLNHSKIVTGDKELLERIFNALKKADLSEKEDEIEILVKLARSFEKNHWLADKIYSRALEMVKKYQFEKTRFDAISQYFYGKFLSGLKPRLREAISYLTSAFNISFGVEEWLVKMDSNSEQLFTTIANELSKSLITLSKQIQNDDPEAALELATKSLKTIKSIRGSENLNLEVDTEIEIGNCLKAMGLLEKALTRFECALEIAKSGQLIHSEFIALLKVSECLKSNDENYEKALIRAKDFAKLRSLTGGEVEVLENLGRFSIERKKVKKALEYLKKAAEIHGNSNETKKLQKIRFLMAPLNGKLNGLVIKYFLDAG